MRYASAADFRRALEARLREPAGGDAARRRTAVGFERLLARLFAATEPGWILKGGYALELRLGGLARATADVDLASPGPMSAADLVDAVLGAVERDTGDLFAFRLAPEAGELRGPPLGGRRFRVECLLDGRTFTRFSLDVGLGDLIDGPADWFVGRTDLGFAGIEPALMPLYPLDAHFAEKLHAYTRPRANPSRVKDLVDLLLLAELGLEPDERLSRQVAVVFERYSTHPLPEVPPQPPEVWRGPYAAMAADLGLPTELSAAYERLKYFVERLTRAS